MSERTTVLDGWLWVPVERVGDVNVLKRTLVHQPRSRQGEPAPLPVPLFDDRIEQDAGYIGLPAAYGLQRWSLDEDHSVLGDAMQPPPRLPDPNHPRVRDPVAQARFMEDLYQGFRTHRTFCATAPTGSGKTVCALHATARLGRKTLILVHLSRLMDQWVEEIKDKLGIPEERIGIQQGERCEFEGKDYVVGMLQSLNQRPYQNAFYRSFGTVVFDEVHKIGTAYFAPACGMFAARYKLGLSATMKRRDGGDKVFFHHLGDIKVTSDAEAMPMKVYTLAYRNDHYRHPLKSEMDHGKVIYALVRDETRNRLIARTVKRFYDTGRNALIVSDNVDHLQTLITLAEELGVPRSAMGQYTSAVHTREGKTVKKRPQKAAALSYVKENSRLIFATYGMITEGIDIPRLDAGIDASPRSLATQLVGRIRRPMPGKKEPVWITLLDDDCPLALKYYKSRVRDYLASNAEVVTNGKAENRAHT